MPLDKFKISGKPEFPTFSAEARGKKYTFRQTGTDGQDPVIQVDLSGGTVLEIRMVITNLEHPHDWTYAITVSGGKLCRYRFGTCDQLLSRLPHILEELESNPATRLLEGRGLSIAPVGAEKEEAHGQDK